VRLDDFEDLAGNGNDDLKEGQVRMLDQAEER
jgi:hypothetical protein